jgi:hypothetical protein
VETGSEAAIPVLPCWNILVMMYIGVQHQDLKIGSEIAIQGLL